jgi:hypothetical protein
MSAPQLRLQSIFDLRQIVADVSEQIADHAAGNAVCRFDLAHILNPSFAGC